jgi:hypothetical protein
MSIENYTPFLTAIRSLVSIGLVIDSLEFLYNTKHLHESGIFSNKIYQKLYEGANGIFYRFNHAISRSVVYFKMLVVVRLLLIGIINIPGLVQYYFICLIVLFFIEVLINNRFLFGRDGSDQMDIMILLGLASVYLLRNEKLEIIGIAFIAFQSCLSYATSGIAKLISPTWTSGNAIVHILNANSYGMRKVSIFFDAVTIRKKSACIMVIVWECLMPLSVFAPRYIMYSLLAMGLVFHLLIAIVMGLNKFFWSWLATYPAIICCNSLFFSQFNSMI